jgi:hypothetical protein
MSAPVHLRHPQATEDDLVESRVGPAGQEAVKLVPSRKVSITLPDNAGTGRMTIVAYNHCLISGPCGDRCCMGYQSMLFCGASAALLLTSCACGRSAKLLAQFFFQHLNSWSTHDVDTHLGGVVRYLSRVGCRGRR